MDIVAALFTEDLQLREAAGPSTRIDLGGVMFSMAAPGPAPVTITPHLIVLVRCRADEPGDGVLVVTFVDDGGHQVARNASPFQVEPGKFTYRLVRAELTYATVPSTIEARCRIAQGPVTAVPLTLLPPV